MAIKRANILCLFGVKGGIGKSITTLNMAGICSNLEKKVLIVDMDLYGGAISIVLNKDVHKTIYNFVDDYNNNRYRDFNDYVTKYNEYIDYVASPKDPRKSSKIDSKYIDILLDKAKFNYDLIILDTTHVLDEINLSLLDKSDKILLMVSDDILDLKNMKTLISIFKDLDIDKYKVLLNNSFRLVKDNFSLYDIRNIIKTNVDYELSNRFYIKDIDKYILDSIIPTMDKKIINTKDYKILESVVNDSWSDE